MIFDALPLSGAYRITYEPFQDDRGYFNKLYSAAFFKGKGLVAEFTEVADARNESKGLIRGLHYQIAPAEETKIVRCLEGSIFDVIVDIRPESPTYGHHASIVLEERELAALYVPAGFAHGYQTLSEVSRVEYFISVPYSADLARGILWSDPSLQIPWPLAPTIVSSRDQAHPVLQR